jgi:hypothetical protein
MPESSLVGCAQPAVPTLAREVERTLTDLRQSIAALESSLDVHIAQLQPVIANGIPTKGGCSDKAPIDSPLAQVIDECATRVRRIAENIQDLTQRVQI